MESLKSSMTIVGFGSQAKAWALNLKDSKQNVKVALNDKSSSRALASQMGFPIATLETQDLFDCPLLALLIPDDQHAKFLEKNHAFLKEGTHIIYAHGFSLKKDQLATRYPQFTHSLLAPKAIASEVRYQYETHGKIGAVYFAPTPKAEEEVRKVAHHAGMSALYRAHYAEETMADLFSEQSLLCSILPYLSLKSYNLLRQNGVGRELAFMECFLELKSISSALVTLGPQAFFKLISPNALIGSQKGRELLLGSDFDRALEKLFADIKNETFYREVDTSPPDLRQKVLAEWDQEELSHVFKQLKKDLIN